MSGVNQWKLKDNSSAFPVKNTNVGAVYTTKTGEPTGSNALKKCNNDVGNKPIPKATEKVSNEIAEKKLIGGGINVRQAILKDSKKPAGGLTEEEKLEGKDGKKNPFVVETSEAEAEGPLNPGHTKGLAGFWANQNDEVKVVKKKRLASVEESITPVVVENTPQKLDGVVRFDDTTEWKKPLQLEEGRTKNIAANISQKPGDGNKRLSLGNVGSKEENEGQRVKVKGMSQQFVRQSSESSWKEKHKIEAIDTMPTAIVLAENQPAELNPDVVRNSDNSEEVVLESGRTKNLLQHWKNTEVDFLTPKVSTTRFQGTKPAWILEIEAAKGIVSDEGKNENEDTNLRQHQEETHEQERVVTDQHLNIRDRDPEYTEKVSHTHFVDERHDTSATYFEPSVSKIAPTVPKKFFKEQTTLDNNSFINLDHSDKLPEVNNRVPDRLEDVPQETTVEKEAVCNVNMEKYLITSNLEASSSVQQAETVTVSSRNEDHDDFLPPNIKIDTPKESSGIAETGELLLPEFNVSPELQNFVGKNLNFDDLLNTDSTKEWQVADKDETPCLTPCGVTPISSHEDEHAYKTIFQTPQVYVEEIPYDDVTGGRAENLKYGESPREAGPEIRKFPETSPRPRSEEIDSSSRNLGNVVDADRPVSCYVEQKGEKKKKEKEKEASNQRSCYIM